MVVLTVVTNENEHTLYFDQPIRKPNYIRLLSCSLYNSWFNLEKEVQINLFDSQKRFVKKLLPGHYTLERLAAEIQDSFKKYDITLHTETYSPHGQMIIENGTFKKIHIDDNLSTLFGINNLLPFITFIKKLNSPTTYFIHCDLVDKEQNLFNGKPSSVLALFDIRGKSYEKIYYQTEKQNVLRETSTGEYVNSLNLSVRDEKGKLFDFNDMPLEFELEIN